MEGDFPSSLQRASKASKGRKASRGGSFAPSRNAMNPRVGSGCDIPQRHGGATRRGGEKPRGRNAEEARNLFSKRGRRQRRSRGSGLQAGETTEGRSLDNPKRGVRRASVEPRWIGSCRESWHEGQEGEMDQTATSGPPPSQGRRRHRRRRHSAAPAKVRTTATSHTSQRSSGVSSDRFPPLLQVG